MSFVIEELEHAKVEVAEEIRRLMVASYAVEASILGVDDFVPLRRSAAAIQSADALFVGVRIDGDLAAASELEIAGGHHLHIGSLVVAPRHFRRGLATVLLDHVVGQYGDREITVSTGVLNTPALALYARHGFVERERWSTPDDIPMVTLGRTAQD